MPTSWWHRAVVSNNSEATVLPLKDVVDKRVEIIKVKDDFFNKIVVHANDTKLKFYVLVIATGSHRFNPISSVYSFGNDYQQHFKEQRDKKESASHIVLDGGGIVNIEVAGELLDRYSGAKKITLIYSSSKMLPDSGFHSFKLRDRLTKFLEHTEMELKYQTQRLQFPQKIQHWLQYQAADQSKPTLLSHLQVSVPLSQKMILTVSVIPMVLSVDDAFQSSAVPKGNTFAIGDVNDLEQ
jgi:pyruvate/2-oxoglutarate dehydrogenase complex dihydrolipoamide dehydrogenase (E3) component